MAQVELRLIVEVGVLVVEMEVRGLLLLLLFLKLLKAALGPAFGSWWCRRWRRLLVIAKILLLLLRRHRRSRVLWKRDEAWTSGI